MKNLSTRTLLFATAFALIGKTSAQNTASLDLDGINDQVVITNGSAAFVGATGYTLSCWVYPTNTAPAYPDFDGFAGIRNELDAAFYLLQISPASTVEGRFQNSDGSEFTIAYGGLSLSTWQHLALVYDGVELSMWHNGDLVVSEPAFGSIANGNVPFYIGNVQFNAVPFLLDGRVDEVALYQRPLDAAEIACLASGAPDAADIDLAFYYDFNEGVPGGNNVGTITLVDQTGNTTAALENFTLTGSSSNFATPPTLGTLLQDDLCDGETYTFNGETLSSPGTYTATFQSSAGCDSTVVLQLSAGEVNTNVVQNGNQLISTAAGAQWQWYTCNNGSYTLIPGATAQYYQATAVGSYAVFVTQACAGYSDCIEVVSIGIEERQLPLFTLAPVPAGDLLNIELNRPVQSAVIAVVDMTGREVLVRGIGAVRKTQLDISSLRPGAYFLRVEADGATRVVRFVRG